MNIQARWIQPAADMGDVCPVFKKEWKSEKALSKAILYMTALGVYQVQLNGNMVGDYVLAPGWTAYNKRLQYQEYDITEQIEARNVLTVLVGKGWFRSPMPGWLESEDKARRKGQPCGIWGEIHLTYSDGSSETLKTDTSWEYGESAVRFSEIYDGEMYDATFSTRSWDKASELNWSRDILIPQEGALILEQERIQAKSVLHTQAGETVVDFGQEVTGYVEFTVHALAGERIRILHGEVLDAKGNFYNENYRSAKAEIQYICRAGTQTWHPLLTFFGFRYIKLADYPEEVKPERFTAIAVYSDMKRTGYFSCSDTGLNQLYSNILWSQKGNFLDVPTDCPQRDERLGWTGDARIFIKAACYLYDVEKFFRKWLRDLAADQREDGAVGQVIPDYLPELKPSAAWGDAATVCPWQLYVFYGDKKVLEEQFESMKKWVDYVTHTTQDRYLWTGGEHFGDWLGLDAATGSYKGSSREDLIATAFYAYSAELVVKAGHVLSENVTEYEVLHKHIVEKFRKTYPVYVTQTEHVLAVQFGLSESPQKTTDSLAAMVKSGDNLLRTGLVGTPYLLHVLSKYGHIETAYSLLLRIGYPSWLYPVGKGATTIWEHWDGIMPDGDFWSADMNSFNHYAYGCVADWIYEVAAGIKPVVESPGFAAVQIEPKPDKRLSWLEASVDTRQGRISSKWSYQDGQVKYEITTEVPAELVIDKKKMKVKPGSYIIWETPGLLGEETTCANIC